MPIDINLLRTDKGGDPDVVRSSEQKRGRDPQVVDHIITVDKEWRENLHIAEKLQMEINNNSKLIGERKKVDRSDKCEDLTSNCSIKKAEQQAAKDRAADLLSRRDTLLNSIGNIIHDSVPVSNDEANNKVIRKWGVPDSNKTIDGTPGKMHHHEVLNRLQGYESKKGVEIAGHRGYFLTGYGVMLNQALIQYGMNFLRRRNYLPVQPPFFMRKEVMAATAELKDFEETLYRIPMGDPSRPETKDNTRDDLFLIATSEQPISALYRDEAVDEKSLPYRYAGISTCFRKEAGSHGRDTWGIFRIHQFEKVEQFVYCHPDESWLMHEEMIQTCEEFYQSLELPYRIVSIVSGAMNDAAAKKYDLEAWFPGYGEYRELVSCSNCTDFQARALGSRLGHPKQGEREKRFVHMLNATLVATQRALCCILENYQKEDGVVVPRVLVPYMDGLEFLPFPEKKE